MTGLLLMVGAMACFPLMQTCVKLALTDHGLSFMQATWGRYFFHLALVPLLFPGTLSRIAGTGRLGVQLSRGLLLFGGTCCAFLALRYLALPQVTALSFIAPAIITLLAALFLREQVGWRRWTAIAVGFVGVLVIVRPTGAFTWPMLLPIAMACLYALYQVLTRLVRDDAPASVSLFYTALVGTAAASLVVPFAWVWPSPVGWMLLVGAAVAGAMGHWLMILAYARVDASAAAPLAYTELVWSASLGFLVFGQTADGPTWIGAAIIIASGIYIAYRERNRVA